MIDNYIQRNKTSLLFVTGLVIFFVLNLFSAINMGVHFDEAYYWLYSQHPAMGYFDHPPMVSWLIIAGQFFFKSTLGLRLFTVIISSVSVYLMWLMSSQRGANPLLFWALIYSVLLIHPYSFVATPDAPLFFFTTLFFWVYQKFIGTNKLSYALVLALITASMFYSKYHAILVVLFVFSSNLTLLTKRNFWIYAATVVLLMLPHLFWQIDNDFVTFSYHLIDSHKTAYDPMVTFEYLFSQVLLAGPWLGWLLLYFLFVNKSKKPFEKGLKWAGVGTFLFFFAGTFSGDFEAHWTLIAFIPLIVIGYHQLFDNKKWYKWVILSGSINFALLLAVRIIVVSPMAEKFKALSYFHGWDTDSKLLKEATGNYPVVFQDTWNKAARFAWYTNNPEVAALHSAFYRKTQFELWDRDEELKGKTVCVVTTDSTQFENSSKVETPKGTWYYKEIEHFTSFYNTTFAIESTNIINNRLLVTVSVNNPYPYTIEVEEPNNNKSFKLYEKRNLIWNIMAENELSLMDIEAFKTEKFNLSFNIENINAKEVYLMLKLGELNPIPVREKIELP